MRDLLYDNFGLKGMVAPSPMLTKRETEQENSLEQMYPTKYLLTIENVWIEELHCFWVSHNFEMLMLQNSFRRFIPSSSQNRFKNRSSCKEKMTIN